MNNNRNQYQKENNTGGNDSRNDGGNRSNRDSDTMDTETTSESTRSQRNS